MIDYEVVTDGLRFPEGPVWLKDGSVVVVEIAGGRITRVYPDGRKEVVANTGGGPNGAALGPDGRIYVCNNGGFEWHERDGLLFPGHQAHDYTTGRIEAVDLETGSVEILYDSCDGFNLSGPNDIVFDDFGGFYFTDFGKFRERDLDQGGIYYAFADGSMIRTVCYPVDHPNGIGLSPDGKTLYVAQSLYRTVTAFDLAGPGELASQDAAIAPFFPGRPIAAFRPGMGLDSLGMLADGKIAVATIIGEGSIAVVDPVTGTYVQHHCPDAATTNICFGGDDMRDAWITQSATGLLIKTRWDAPGLRLPHYD